ncbi:sigma-70 family RNA polymerase sigma factor [Vagococcus acidifermentans]|uniref:Uncharacterized protein n=1 Tax=Vagococcus acidifermentans TaxID=564710 RepID=A0A430B0C0_9ENTE|nr:sigma-70 family RNA polymerase sigma factor [Vagococcus acidifermentans]RSU13749.1 hypothetical protein CBF27_02280 [Vagococcus acidifermentans]
MNEVDKQIIDLMTQKDFSGLELLIETYGYHIVQSIRRILTKPNEASEITAVENDVFYKIWKNSHLFDDRKSSLKTWVCTIAKREALDYKRQMVRRRDVVPFEEIEDSSFIEEQWLAKDEFLQLIDVLNLEDQLIFLKYFFYQEKGVDIAKDLQLSTDTIYSRLNRGKKKIREAWQKQQEKGIGNHAE